MGNEPGNNQKKKVRHRVRNLFKCFQATRKRWINCEESHSSESEPHGHSWPSELPKTLCSVSLLRAATAEPQVTLPELTRTEQTAFPPPGMSVSQLLRIRISWWRFWLTSHIFYDLFLKHVAPFFYGKNTWDKWAALFNQFSEGIFYTYWKNIWLMITGNPSDKTSPRFVNEDLTHDGFQGDCSSFHEIT